MPVLDWASAIGAATVDADLQFSASDCLIFMPQIPLQRFLLELAFFELVFAVAGFAAEIELVNGFWLRVSFHVTQPSQWLFAVAASG
jgi:hypothetical protein